MEEKKDWKELLHKSLRSMQLGFSGSQVDWIDNFVESVEQEAERRGYEKGQDYQARLDRELYGMSFEQIKSGDFKLKTKEDEK